MSTFKKMSVKAMGSTSKIGFIQAIRNMGKIEVVGMKIIPEDKPKIQANITHGWGRYFVEITDPNDPKKTLTLGYDMFCQTILESGLESKVDMNTDTEDEFRLAFEGRLGDAYQRQEKRYNKAKDKATS